MTAAAHRLLDGRDWVWSVAEQEVNIPGTQNLGRHETEHGPHAAQKTHAEQKT